MSKQVYNFSAGPAVLPRPVLEEAREGLLDLAGTGIGVMEHSHRGKAFLKVYEETEALCRELGGISSDYDVLFLQGGASSQFFMIPMNFLPQEKNADYILTGSWAKTAAKEAKLFGQIHTAASSEDRNCCYIPKNFNYSSAPAYVHYTSNNTIFGTQFRDAPQPPSGFLVCDASSDIYSRPIDVSRHGIIYAGAQKNLGPSGVTLVIIRKDIVEQGPQTLPTMLQYRTHSANQSMHNTPPTFGIYVMGLVFQWIKNNGGLAAMARHNAEKAAPLYAFLDQSKLFKGTADVDSRSLMNVTFVTGKPEVDEKFLKESQKAGFDGLKGHRSVGGMRASIYNAFPKQGVVDLVQFMRDFEAVNV